MPRNVTQEIYSEVDAFFRLGNDRQLKKSVNGDAVADSIRNIVKTKKGERVMNPDFGCGLHRLLFEPMDNETAALIGEEILDSIEREDDRVVIERILVTPNFETRHYHVAIDYYIRKVAHNVNRVTMLLAGQL